MRTRRSPKGRERLLESFFLYLCGRAIYFVILGPRIDKYGRSVSRFKEQEDLRKFYRLENEDGDESSASEAGPSKRVDYARGEVLMESSDESEESDAGSDVTVTLGAPSHQGPRRHIDEDELEIDLDEEDFADLDEQALAAKRNPHQVGFGDQRRTTAKGEETRRLAVVNLDWDHIRAADLYKVFSSTAAMMESGTSKDKKARVKNVRVYPSQYGKERMAKEDLEGPPIEIFADKKKPEAATPSILLSLKQRQKATARAAKERELTVDEINEKTIFQEDDADQFDQEALRKYQLERLRCVSDLSHS